MFTPLKIISDWTTRIELNGKSLDFSQYYDIKTPKGKLFTGCKIIANINHHPGMGGMDRSHTTIIPTFKADDLIIQLQSGFLMQINEQVTKKKYIEKMEKIKQTKLQRLSKEKDEIDKKINYLKNK